MKEARACVRKRDKTNASKYYDEALKHLHDMKDKIKDIPDDPENNFIDGWLDKFLIWELIDQAVNVARGGTETNISRTQATFYINKMISSVEREKRKKLSSI